MLTPLVLVALMFAIASAMAAPSTPSSSLQPRYVLPTCFPTVPGADLPYAFDAGQTPANDWRDCAVRAWQARKPGAVWREDQNMCYFKTFPQNGAKTYHSKWPADRALGAFDIPGYDERSFKTLEQAYAAGCTVYVENGGRIWCKKFPRCDACTLIFPRLAFDHCDR